MIVKIDAVIGLKEHQVRNSSKQRAVFFLGLTGFFLDEFPVGDVQRDAPQSDHFRSSIKDRTQIILDPANAAVLCSPTEFANTILAGLNDSLTFLPGLFTVFI